MIATLASLLPLATLSILTAATLAPWLPTTSATLALALLPAATLHYWALRRPSAIPSLAVLFCGLSADIMLAGPPGFWTTIYALAWTIGLLQRPSATRYWKFGRWGLFTIAMTVCVGAAALIGEIVAAPTGSWLDLLTAWALTILAYPAVAGLLRLCDFAPSDGRFDLESA